VPLLGKHLVWDGSRYLAEVIQGELQTGMKVISEITLTRALVIEQSCDSPLSLGVALAPLVSWQPEGKGEDQWKSISRMATSLANPTRFYLPDHPSLGPERYLAELGRKFFLPAPVMNDLIKAGKRIATLSPTTIAYLQFRLGVMYQRAAREDYDWPSVEDLKLKRGFLQKQIDSKEAELIGQRGKLEQVLDEGEAERLKARIAVLEDVLRTLRPEFELCDNVLRDKTNAGE
jgi:hypothetical protein